MSKNSAPNPVTINKGNPYFGKHEHAICQYVRNRTTRRRKGIIVAIKNKSDPKGFSMGWSMFNKHAEGVLGRNFDKTAAYDIALVRANSGNCVPAQSIKKDWEYMEKRAEKYFNQENVSDDASAPKNKKDKKDKKKKSDASAPKSKKDKE